MKEQYDIYIGRGPSPKDGNISKWGNPYSHQLNSVARFKVNSRNEALDKYREWIQSQPQLMSALHELKGKTLGCWCKPYYACHGDILAELVDKI